MGLINPDVFVFDNGMEKANTYISFANQMIYVRREGDNMPASTQSQIETPDGPVYHVNSSYSIFASKEARDAGKPYIQIGQIGVMFQNPNQNVYAIMYDELKKRFPNGYEA